MAALIQNGRQPNPKSRYLSFWISYLSDLSGLIKVFWTKEYNAEHHYNVKWFFRGFWSVFDLYSFIFWQNCVIHLRHHSYIWMTSSQNEFIIRTLFWIHILTWYKVKPYKLHVYDSDKIGKKHHLHYNTELLCCRVCKTTTQGVNIKFSGKLTVWDGVL